MSACRPQERHQTDRRLSRESHECSWAGTSPPPDPLRRNPHSWPSWWAADSGRSVAPATGYDSSAPGRFCPCQPAWPTVLQPPAHHHLGSTAPPQPAAPPPRRASQGNAPQGRDGRSGPELGAGEERRSRGPEHSAPRGRLRHHAAPAAPWPAGSAWPGRLKGRVDAGVTALRGDLFARVHLRLHPCTCPPGGWRPAGPTASASRHPGWHVPGPGNGGGRPPRPHPEDAASGPPSLSARVRACDPLPGQEAQAGQSVPTSRARAATETQSSVLTTVPPVLTGLSHKLKLNSACGKSLQRCDVTFV